MGEFNFYLRLWRRSLLKKLLAILLGCLLYATAYGQQQIINTGVAPNTGTGDTLQVWATKDNANFTQLFGTGLPGNLNVTTATVTGAASLGSVTIGSPTGGNVGAGTLNAASTIFENGTPLPVYFRTTWEAADSVTPSNYIYNVGNIFRYLTPLQQADVINRTHLYDDTAAFTAASASGAPSLYLPDGDYNISNQITLQSGQCIGGSTQNSAQVVIGPNFSNTATSVFTWAYNPSGVATQWRDQANVCMHDMTITGAQPSGGTTTATAAQPSATNTIQVAAAVPLHYYVNDITTQSAIPIHSNVEVTAISGTGPYTLTLSGNIVGGVLNGDQIAFNAARDSFQPVGSCTNTATGTGCIYPTYIDTQGRGGILQNLILAGAWNCINSEYAGGFWMDTIRCGALNVGWQADGAADFIFVKNWESHAHWGLNTTGGFGLVDAARGDGVCVGWQLGRADGILADTAGFFDCGIVATANSSNSLGMWQWNNFWLDNDNVNLVMQGTQRILLSNLVKSGHSWTSSCPIDIGQGSVWITQGYLELFQGPEVCVYGTGSLNFTRGQVFSTSTTANIFNETAGTMIVRDVQFRVPNTTTAAFINSTGGQVQLTGNYFPSTGTTGIAINITTDNAANVSMENYTAGFSQALPAAPTTGVYWNSHSMQGPMTVNGNLNVTGTSTFTGAVAGFTSSGAITATGFTTTGTVQGGKVEGTNGTGGALLQLTDTTSGDPAPNKYFAIAVGSGTLNILNSGFTQNILSLTNAGALTVPASLGINGAAAPAQVTGFGTATGSGVINNFPGASATLAQATETIAELINILKAYGIIGN